MEFIAYYKKKSKEEKRELRDKIIDACLIQPPTFYGWLFRGKVPPLAKKVIAELLKKEQKELFPEKENELLTN